MIVWAVVYGNYEPSEVASLYETEESARAEVERLNANSDSHMWDYFSWKVKP